MIEPLRIKSGDQGFTLIELLVVISIIALLIGILLPVLSSARDTARQISCISTNKQVGLGLFIYMQDNNQIYPPFADYTQPPATRKYWPGLVGDTMDIGWRPNAVAHELMFCPSQEDKFVIERAISYGYNFLELSRWVGPPAVSGWRKVQQFQVTSPSNMIVLAETRNPAFPQFGDYVIELPLTSPNYLPTTTVTLAQRHPSADPVAATLWADGHAAMEQHTRLLENIELWQVAP